MDKSMVTVEKLDHLASDVVRRIDHCLNDQKIIESVVDTYRQVCRTDNVHRLGVCEKEIDREVWFRLRFECLCFCVFCVALQATKYLRSNVWILKKRNQRLVESFHGAIGVALIKLCTDAGMNRLRDLKLTAIEPKPTFVLGDHLDPITRLDEYLTAHKEDRGSELERFGKWVGKALDAPNYPLFEMIGGHFGRPLAELSDYAIEGALQERTL